MKTTYGLLLEKEITNWWSGHEIAGAYGLGDLGVSPIPTRAIGSPSYAASTPMVSEPIIKAFGLNGSSSAFWSYSNAAVLAPDQGTFLTFFKTGAAVSSAPRLFAKEVGVGSTAAEIYLYTGQIVVNLQQGGSIASVCGIEPGSIELDVWHLFAARQPKDGTGMNFFYDGTHYPHSDPDVTQYTLKGGYTLDSWLAASGNTGRVGIGVRGTDGGNTNYFSGEMFHVIVDARVWDDAELTEMWETALANGLNA